MLKGKKAAKKKKLLNAKVTHTPDVEVSMFQIETDPPPFRTQHADTVAFIKRAMALIPHLKPGQAFILPVKGHSGFKKYLKQEYPDRRYLFAKVTGNPSVRRVYYVDSKKK
jgi:hypothetical protein